MEWMENVGVFRGTECGSCLAEVCASVTESKTMEGVDKHD